MPAACRGRAQACTVGTESNVKEIYDACNELAKDPGNVVFNQFCEFGNHLAHFEVTGRALGHVFETVAATRPPGSSRLRLAAFTSAAIAERKFPTCP